MTAQAAEILHYKGETLGLCATPLEPYLANNPLPLDSATMCTACWRGYIGEWLIEDRRLYLVGLTDLDDEPIPLSKLFPGNPSRIFAHWVTEELRCPQGRMLSYFHGGFGSVFERDLMLDVKQGILVSERIVQNGTSTDPDAPPQYGPAAWVSMSSDRGSE